MQSYVFLVFLYSIHGSVGRINNARFEGGATASSSSKQSGHTPPLAPHSSCIHQLSSQTNFHTTISVVKQTTPIPALMPVGYLHRWMSLRMCAYVQYHAQLNTNVNIRRMLDAIFFFFNKKRRMHLTHGCRDKAVLYIGLSLIWESGRRAVETTLCHRKRRNHKGYGG